MCNLSEGIEQRGIEKGVQQGTQQGIQQMVLNALQSNSIEDVSRILLLPIEKVEKIANEQVSVLKKKFHYGVSDDKYKYLKWE